MKVKWVYWNFLSQMMKKSIKTRYSSSLADKAIHQGKKEYEKLVTDAPNLGRGNRMSENAYFAYAFVACWLGSEKKITPDGMAEVMKDVLERLRLFFSLVNMNKKPKYWYKSMKKYEKWYNKGNGEKYPTTWKVHFDEKKHQDGSYFYFSICPICLYLNSKGLGEIMNSLCATDKIMYGYQHGVLHRENTIASGKDICDYWIVGDQVKDPK